MYDYLVANLTVLVQNIYEDDLAQESCSSAECVHDTCFFGGLIRPVYQAVGIEDVEDLERNYKQSEGQDVQKKCLFVKEKSVFVLIDNSIDTSQRRHHRDVND